MTTLQERGVYDTHNETPSSITEATSSPLPTRSTIKKKRSKKDPKIATRVEDESQLPKATSDISPSKATEILINEDDPEKYKRNPRWDKSK